MNKTDQFHVRSISLHWYMIRRGHPRTHIDIVTECEKKEWLRIDLGFVGRAFTCTSQPSAWGLRVSRPLKYGGVDPFQEGDLSQPLQRRFRPISEGVIYWPSDGLRREPLNGEMNPARAFASAILQVLSGVSPLPSLSTTTTKKRRRLLPFAIFKTHSISLKWILSPEESDSNKLIQSVKI